MLELYAFATPGVTGINEEWNPGIISLLCVTPLFTKPYAKKSVPNSQPSIGPFLLQSSIQCSLIPPAILSLPSNGRAHADALPPQTWVQNGHRHKSHHATTVFSRVPSARVGGRLCDRCRFSNGFRVCGSINALL